MTTATLEQPQAPPRLETLDDYVAWVGQLVDEGDDLQPLVNMLLTEKFETSAAMEQIREHHEEMREYIEILCMPEQHPVVITAVHTSPRLSVEVAGGVGRLRVSVHPEVERASLKVGARGLLSQKKNCLLAVYEVGTHYADVGTFEEMLPGGKRLLVRHQEQLIAVGVAESMRGVEMKKGDLVGFDREGSRLAFSRVEQPGRQDLFFEKTPPDRFDELGGLDAEIRILRQAVEFGLRHPEVAAKYGLKAKRGILLEGPPGNGKTKLARCIARLVADLVPGGECHFMAIAGSSDYSMWLGQSEQKLIARFDAARDLATRSKVPVVMFFDEIDAIGRRRGSDMGSGAPDRILATLLAQLDGINQVPGLIVIGATNRADILDPGLVRAGRLGDIKVRIPSPNRAGAGAILRGYLKRLPLAERVELLVGTMLGRLYAAQGTFAEVARVTLRDGSRVVVRGRDLVSGALLENVVQLAAERAADRAAQGDDTGVSEDDLTHSLDREMRGMANLLTAGNVRGYVSRLPADREPIGVEVLLGA